MQNYQSQVLPSFLCKEDDCLCENALITLNLILNGLNSDKKPYKIDYHMLMMSYSLWKGDNLDEFCHKQALSYFLFNPINDSAVAREALYIEIREFLTGI
ncbi:hypothetical protein MTsPCn9_02220 [Croceitalea sp. MTPC9]|uniref:hypothetical protein n=1 Tax=unclassified Croceitalea TaxID=2632280 RepID=UPI002B38F6A9|nr:hypothetical protein MTsPCn6_06490 [Croceitalea sp. MTPC6]GMN15286.1 hypothetical protein MTsPCn9_02220 [Croceitalea sp. MTPC9]